MPFFGSIVYAHYMETGGVKPEVSLLTNLRIQHLKRLPELAKKQLPP